MAADLSESSIRFCEKASQKMDTRSASTNALHVMQVFPFGCDRAPAGSRNPGPMHVTQDRWKVQFALHVSGTNTHDLVGACGSLAGRHGACTPERLAHTAEGWPASTYFRGNNNLNLSGRRSGSKTFFITS